MTLNPLYISDGDDDNDISFVGTSQLPRRPITVVAIASDSDSDGESLPDVLKLLRTQTSHASHANNGGKGKGKATSTLLDVIDSLDTIQSMENGSSHPTGPSTLHPHLKKGKVKQTENTVQEGLEDEPDDRNLGRAGPSKEAISALKEEEKKRKRLEKDAVKAAKEAEKSLQRKISEVNKLRTSKDATIREIHLYMSADLESPSSPLAGALPEIRHRLVDNCSEIHFMSESESPIAGTIRFKRHVRSRYSHERKAWIPIDEPRWEWEPTILLVITATELVDKIVSGEHALREWVADVKLALRVTQNYQLIVMIKGLQKYYSKMKSQANKEYTTAARAGLGVGTTPRHHLHHQPTKDEIEGELVQLQVAEGCFLVHVEKTEDLEDWVFNLAGDVAIRPYKLLSKSHLAFCATDAVKKGHTPGDTFELMLQEVHGITQSAAAGVASEFHSFKALMEAYEKAERKSLDRAESMLQDCEIRNLRNGIANGRKLKTALSKRTYNVFRGEDSLALV